MGETPPQTYMLPGNESARETPPALLGDNQENSHASGKGTGKSRLYRPLGLPESHQRRQSFAFYSKSNGLCPQSFKSCRRQDDRAVQGAAFRSQSDSPGVGAAFRSQSGSPGVGSNPTSDKTFY
ncbi:hypothetical protein DPMN_043961 [Dreissena polymorpha]|uniref:Uncharacterized protein n=1 Tax=Dreissena polymorpha TaxID=45954 RepID=A0A9D4D3R2_DREPO|nr:hypothetical protein DPMN_043961 [Dreissena polymorpha]